MLRSYRADRGFRFRMSTGSLRFSAVGERASTSTELKPETGASSWTGLARRATAFISSRRYRNP